MQTFEIALKGIPERFLIARKRLGYDQSEMASLLGMSRTTYTNIENGKRGVSVELILQMHELLNLPFDWLLKGKGEIPEINTETLQRIQLQGFTA